MRATMRATKRPGATGRRTDDEARDAVAARRRRRARDHRGRERRLMWRGPRPERRRDRARLLPQGRRVGLARMRGRAAATALRWDADATSGPPRAGLARVRVTLADSLGAPVAGATVRARGACTTWRAAHHVLARAGRDRAGRLRAGRGARPPGPVGAAAHRGARRATASSRDLRRDAPRRGAPVIALAGSVLVASLLGSPHCAGMCGGFVCFYAAPGRARAGARARRLQPRPAGLVPRARACWPAALGRTLDQAGAGAGLHGAAAFAAGAAMIAWGGATLLAAAGARVPHAAAPGFLRARFSAAVRAVHAQPPAVRAAHGRARHGAAAVRLAVGLRRHRGRHGRRRRGRRW